MAKAWFFPLACQCQPRAKGQHLGPYSCFQLTYAIPIAQIAGCTEEPGQVMLTGRRKGGRHSSKLVQCREQISDHQSVLAVEKDVLGRDWHARRDWHPEAGPLFGRRTSVVYG